MKSMGERTPPFLYEGNAAALSAGTYPAGLLGGLLLWGLLCMIWIYWNTRIR